MSLLLLALLAAMQDTPPQAEGARYQTKKSLPAVVQCLTDGLSKRGDVTAIQAEGYITLLFQDDTHLPMLIDVAPPNVIVRTEIVFGTRGIIESCL
jgi:hypothetical protein